MRITRTIIHYTTVYNTYWRDPCSYKCSSVAKGNRSRQQCLGSYQPKLNHWDSRRARADRTHTPSIYRSTEHLPQPCSLQGRGHLEGFVLLLPALVQYHQYY